MGEITFEKEKNVNVFESGIEIGDILCGQTHMYRTVTYWYQVVDITMKQLKLRRLQVSYPTEYMDNTPGDQCMPVLEYSKGKKKVYALVPGFPYWSGPREEEIVKATVCRIRTMEEMPDGKKKVYEDWQYHADIMGDKYAPILSLWYGEPGWVNCD